MDAFIGEVRAFGFGYVPQDWLLCDGSTVAIQQYQALYATIGVAFGGDGRTNFKLPNLDALAPMHWGPPSPQGGPGMPTTRLGQSIGATEVALSSSQLPPHSHPFNGASAAAAVASPVGALPSVLAAMPNRQYFAYQTGNAANAQFAAPTVGAAGSVAPAAHENRQPSLSLLFCICWSGTYAPRP